MAQVLRGAFGLGGGVAVEALWVAAGIFALLLLASPFIALAVFLVVRSRRDRGGFLRRFFLYGMLLLSGVLAAAGLSGLLALADPDVEAGTGYTAFMLSCVIVGAPVLLLTARRVRRALAAGEGAAGWEIYLTVAELTGLLTAAGAAVVWGRSLLLDFRFDVAPAAAALVWGAVWLIHHRIAGGRPRSDRLRWGVILGSLAGLAGTAVFAVVFLEAVLQMLYDSAAGTALVSSAGETLRSSTPGLAVWGAVWVRYWWVPAPVRDPLWRGYVLLAGVAGGLLTMLAGVWDLSYRILDWWLGNAGGLSAGMHFMEAPRALALAAVGGFLWRHHRAALGPGGAPSRTEVDRVHDYMVAGIGLLAAAGGLTAVAAAVIEASFPGGFYSSDRSALAAAVTVLLVGGPLWLRCWAPIQRRRRADPAAELGSTTRRIYLVCLFGAGGLAALVSLLILVYTVLDLALAGALDDWVFYDIRWPLALTAVVGAAAGYHRAVRRADLAEAIEQEAPAVAVRSVVLVGRSVGEAARMVQERTGAEVQVWERPDAEAPPLAPDGVEALIQAVETSEHRRLLAVVRRRGVEVVPYEAAQP